MKNFGNILQQKREYFLMGALLAAVLFLVPTALCWHGSIALLEWRAFSLTLIVLSVICFSLGAYFFHSPKRYFVLLLLFSAFLAMPIWGALLSGIEITWLNNAGYLCQSLVFALSMSGISIYLSAVFKNHWLKRAVFLAVSFVPVMFAAVFVGYIFSSHAWLNTDAVMMILQTNPSEAFEYCRTFLSFWNVIALVSFFALWIIFSVYAGSLERKPINGVYVFFCTHYYFWLFCIWDIVLWGARLFLT